MSESEDVVFRAIADGTRRRILEELAKRDDQTLYELCVRLVSEHQVDMTRQAVRKHLGILEDAGLVTTAMDGKYKRLTFTGRDALAVVKGWIGALDTEQ